MEIPWEAQVLSGLLVPNGTAQEDLPRQQKDAGGHG